MRKKQEVILEDFEYTEVDKGIFKETVDFDIDATHEKVWQEMSLQQSKRDQLLMIYLAALAFIFPSLLSDNNLDSLASGIVFIGLGLIGFLFSLIIVRYRIYKEVYWHCCRTLSVMMSVDRDKRTKSTIQGIFYNCLRKKIKSYITADGKFKTFRFVTKNAFSSETLYLVILGIISNSVLGCGVGIIVPFEMPFKILTGALCGVALFVVIMAVYYHSLIKVYKVCVDKKEKSFNETFGNAWFFHFYI